MFDEALPLVSRCRIPVWETWCFSDGSVPVG
jgi:hypothetical protein